MYKKKRFEELILVSALRIETRTIQNTKKVIKIKAVRTRLEMIFASINKD